MSCRNARILELWELSGCSQGGERSTCQTSIHNNMQSKGSISALVQSTSAFYPCALFPSLGLILP